MTDIVPALPHTLPQMPVLAVSLTHTQANKLCQRFE